MNPIPALKSLLCCAFLVSAVSAAATEQWGVFEITLQGPAVGNPFTEVDLSARFTQGTRAVQVAGFYDGDGVYKVRFMPDAVGEWRYQTTSNRGLNGRGGSLASIEPWVHEKGPPLSRRAMP